MSKKHIHPVYTFLTALVLVFMTISSIGAGQPSTALAQEAFTPTPTITVVETPTSEVLPAPASTSENLLTTPVVALTNTLVATEPPTSIATATLSIPVETTETPVTQSAESGMVGEMEASSISSLASEPYIRPILAFPMPIDKQGTVKYSQGQHISEFKKYGANKIVVQNATKGVKSSIDLSYVGPVNAPMSGIVKVFADCGTGGQILFIWDQSSGFAVAVVHIKATVKHNQPVTQGQYIGNTLAPQKNSCGTSPAHHVHMSLLKSSDGVNFDEQDITDIRIGQWQLKSDRSMRSIWTNTVAWDYLKSSTKYYLTDYAKIKSTRNTSNVIETYNKTVWVRKYLSGNKNQQWIIVPALNDPGYYYLKSVALGKCVTASSGTSISYSTCWTESQKFKFVSVPEFSGQFAIQSKTSGKVLDVPTNWADPNSGKSNLQIQQWQAFFGDNQRWIFAKP